MVFRDKSLFVVRVLVHTRLSETDDARIIYRNPQYTFNISELGKYTRIKRNTGLIMVS